MHVKNWGVPIERSEGAHAVPYSGRGTVSGLFPASLERVRSQPDRGHENSGDEPTAEGGQPAAGEFAVRWERQRVTLIMWLSGALDRATATLLSRELDARPTGTMRLVVDLTGLEFIDSPGLDALARVHWRATSRPARVSFRHGPHVAQRPLELIRTVQLHSRGATPPAVESDGTFYFALAMACVDVDHSRPRVIGLGKPGQAPRRGSRRERRVFVPRASLTPRHLHLAADPRGPRPLGLGEGSDSLS
jgi:anti-anti-sigma regulatory factor